MSGGEAIGRGRADAAIVVGREYVLPLDLTTGRLAVTAVGGGGGGGAPVVSGTDRPIALITPGAAANSFTITGTTNRFLVYGFYWQVPTTVVAGLYAQLFLGNVAPTTTVTVPLKRSPNPVTPGEEYVFEPPEGLSAMPPGAQDAFIMTLSSTQDVYTTPVGTYAFQARATGRF